MDFSGGCYCGDVRYVATGGPVLKAQCHCRECQYITGGSPNLFMGMPVAGFRYEKGTPGSFTRTDLEKPVTREFCTRCGTHLTTRAVGYPLVIVKVGSLDDPAQYGGPDIAIYVADRQPFHVIPDGMPQFSGMPGA